VRPTVEEIKESVETSNHVPETELEWALNALARRQTRYRQYRAYYEGRTALKFVSEEFAEQFERIVRTLNYNRCKRLIGAHADRLQIKGFSVESGNEGLAAKAQKIWSRNRMDVKAGQVHVESLTLGDGYVIVWPDETGLSRIYPQYGDRVAVVYDQDEPDQISGAVKVWRRRDRNWRVNWYSEEGLFKFITKKPPQDDALPSEEKQLEEWQEDNEAWPLPYPDKFTRIPVFHFPNDPDIDNMGTSELVDVINRQDHLNKTLANLLVSGEAYALPQWYLMGLEPIRNSETGAYELPFDPSSKLWVFGDKEINAGQFDPANIEHLLKELDAIDDQISSISGVPVYWLRPMGDPPSGEALKTLEAPFTRKLTDRMGTLGNGWEDVQTFCLAAEGEAIGDSQLASVWEPAELRNDTEFWTIAQLKIAAGVPEEQIWEESGYTAEQIAKFKAQAEADKAAEQEQMASMLGQRSFDRGSGFSGAGEDQPQTQS
jgi:hypothetical protein